ncbi:MAG: histidinol-phosphate transaminase [Gordonia sp. (in: high G+C Gram-positive bacteria)]
MTVAELENRAEMKTPVVRALVDRLPRYTPGVGADAAEIAALASNESHHAPLPSVLEAIAATAGRINRYPDTTSGALRTAIAGHTGVDPDCVAVGAGSLGVFSDLVATMCNPGDEMVYAWRSFEAYPLVARLAGVRATEVALRRDESHDLPAMLAAITPRTRMVIICSPNNPTGVSVAAAEFSEFMRQVPREVLVVIDAAYGEYVTDPSVLDAREAFGEYPNVAVLQTFSKAYGLAALRIGYVVARPEIAGGIRRVALPFAVNAVAQQAAIASLAAVDELRDRVAEVIAERARMVNELRASGWQIGPSDANFLWLRLSDDEGEYLVERCADAGIVVRRYPGDGVRITLADNKTNDRVLEVLGGC